MILIKNKQNKIQVNQPKIIKQVNSILKSLGYEDFDIGIWLTTNQTIRKYNKNFRKKDKATNILSFPFHTDLKPGSKIKISHPDDKNLGDIIISLEFCKKDSLELNLPFSDYLIKIIVHGIAHLLGYDHKTDKQFKKMSQFENKILNLLDISHP